MARRGAGIMSARRAGFSRSPLDSQAGARCLRPHPVSPCRAVAPEGAEDAEVDAWPSWTKIEAS
jgi:hypothetical protein